MKISYVLFFVLFILGRRTYEGLDEEPMMVDDDDDEDEEYDNNKFTGYDNTKSPHGISKRMKQSPRVK